MYVTVHSHEHASMFTTRRISNMLRTVTTWTAVVIAGLFGAAFFLPLIIAALQMGTPLVVILFALSFFAGVASAGGAFIAIDSIWS